jgi:hypothetical protein
MRNEATMGNTPSTMLAVTNIQNSRVKHLIVLDRY